MVSQANRVNAQWNACLAGTHFQKGETDAGTRNSTC